MVDLIVVLWCFAKYFAYIFANLFRQPWFQRGTHDPRQLAIVCTDRLPLPRNSRVMYAGEVLMRRAISTAKDLVLMKVKTTNPPEVKSN